MSLSVVFNNRYMQATFMIATRKTIYKTYLYSFNLPPTVDVHMYIALCMKKNSELQNIKKR